jgi:hypothetical protein
MKWKKLTLNMVVAFVVVYVIAYCFHNTELLYQWEPALNRFAIKPGTVHRYRSEGWGTSTIGKYDVQEIQDISKAKGPKLVIWGDSNIEAFQIDGDQKVPQVLTGMASNGGAPFLAFEVGHSGDCIADYYFSIPKYERLVSDIRAHVIVISGVGDVLPDTSEWPNSLFLSSPTLRLIEGHPFAPRPSMERIKTYIHGLGFDFLIKLYGKVIRLKPQFLPASRKKKTPNESEEGTVIDSAVTNRRKEAWDFLLSRLRAQTKVPIIVVYCPKVPDIRRGKISFDDKHKDLMDAFGAACRSHRIGFVNTEESFVDYFRSTQRFPRGFPNSRLAEGHLNAEGHRLLSARIFQYINQEGILNLGAHSN